MLSVEQRSGWLPTSLATTTANFTNSPFSSLSSTFSFSIAASQIQLFPDHKPVSVTSSCWVLQTLSFFSLSHRYYPFFPCPTDIILFFLVPLCSAPVLFLHLLHTWNYLLLLCVWGDCSQAKLRFQKLTSITWKSLRGPPQICSLFPTYERVTGYRWLQ